MGREIYIRIHMVGAVIQAVRFADLRSRRIYHLNHPDYYAFFTYTMFFGAVE